MSEPHIDSWRHGVSQDLGEIKANIKYLVDAYAKGSDNLEALEQKHDTRIKALEVSQNRRDGIILAIATAFPLFADKIRSFIFG
jgi:hypothetical protein